MPAKFVLRGMPAKFVLRGIPAKFVGWAAFFCAFFSAAAGPPPPPSSSLKLRSCWAAETAPPSNLAI